ncbi:MAG: hypothetical protein ACI4PG_02190 [Candidatus Ventricola sp.]
MTNGKRAAAWARAQIGTPYEQMDCIGLIVQAIRSAEGASGESLAYRCGGTNELWRSLNASGKYRYITRRVTMESAQALGLVKPGALLCIWEAGHNDKYGDDEGDCSHMGMVVGDEDCEVVHASKSLGRVAASTLANGWTHVLTHRLIDLECGDTEDIGYAPIQTHVQATVCTQHDPLMIREQPFAGSRPLGKVWPGGRMTVVGQAVSGTDGFAWLPVEAVPDNRRSAVRGYACAMYLKLDAQTEQKASDGDGVRVPRDDLLALSDALSDMEYFDSFNSSNYIQAVGRLEACARTVCAAIGGDD